MGNKEIAHEKLNNNNMNSKIILNEAYYLWINELKQRVRQSQIKAAVKVNQILLQLYWSIGKDIVTQDAETKWGNGTIEQLSTDLRTEFPDMQGFSTRNIWYMKKWYLFYYQSDIILHQLGAETEASIFSIPWRHNIEIITKCKNPNEASFYVNQTIENGWSRSVLINQIDTNLYQAKGKAITNFSTTLPAIKSDLAQEVLKDPYNFDFLTLTTEYRERELEIALTQNITSFLLELGAGFAFVGRQKEIVVNNKSYFIDMLFYHIKLKCYVVVELKTNEFEPEHAGKLNFYVTAVDRLIRSENENPTIGLLICKSKDNIVAEYALADINKPLGVSEYELKNILPHDLQSTLPSIEELERSLKNSLISEEDKNEK